MKDSQAGLPVNSSQHSQGGFQPTCAPPSTTDGPQRKVLSILAILSRLFERYVHSRRVGGYCRACVESGHDIVNH